MRAKLITALLLCFALISCEKDETNVTYLTKWVGTYEGRAYQEINLFSSPYTDKSYVDLRIVVSEGASPYTLDLQVQADDEDPHLIKEVPVHNSGVVDIGRNPDRDSTRLENIEFTIMGDRIEFYYRLFSLNGIVKWEGPVFKKS